jgi:imidazolonepropionase-like amidohydrolase
MQRLIVNVIAIFSISFSSVTHPIVPVPAADQSEPIAITGAVIHIGNGMIVNDGIITFDRGLITAVGVAGGGINLVNHALIDVEGRHVYPGFVLPNSTLGLIEVNSVRATSDVLEEGDINASVRSAIAYNTDSEIIPANRFNGILTAQVAPQGGLISGSSTVFKLDGWN